MGHDPVAQKRKRSIDEEQIPDAMCDAAIAEAPKEVSRVLLHSEHWHDFIYEELLPVGGLSACCARSGERFVAATIRGWTDAVAGPEGAAHITIKYGNKLEYPHELAINESQRSADQGRADPFGVSKTGEWETLQKCSSIPSSRKARRDRQEFHQWNAAEVWTQFAATDRRSRTASRALVRHWLVVKGLGRRADLVFPRSRQHGKGPRRVSHYAGGASADFP